MAGEARRSYADEGTLRLVATDDIEHALTLGCVPQWRSLIGNEASARVGDKLGFVDLGRQVFVRVSAPF